MSYILDAIQKAERQRQKHDVPTLESLAVQNSNQARGISKLRIVILAILVCGFVACIWYRQPIATFARPQIALLADNISIYAKLLFDSKATNEKLTTQPISSKSGDTGAITEDPQNTETAMPATVEYSLPQLSDKKRKILESLNFSVVSYSKDANKRFIMEGSRVFHEGDEFMGFIIKAIEKSAVVMTTDGNDFRIKL